MGPLPIFLSVVCVVRNQEVALQKFIDEASRKVSPLVADYELIIVDNASSDNSIKALKAFTSETGFPNLQVYALTKEVDRDIATWAGLENALGDFVAVIDPMIDDINFLPNMLDQAVEGVDVIFANNLLKSKQRLAYRAAYTAFNSIYRSFNRIHLSDDAPQYRVLSKRVINFILQHPMPAITYRHLPAAGGFTRINMEYSTPPIAEQTKSLSDGINRGIRLLVSTTQAPMRLVTSLSFFGAVANLIYSFYVIAVGILKEDVAEGWVSLSLQQSGMFFLISLVLLVLGEYILHMTSLSNEGPMYHVGQEFNSVRISRTEKLNIEDTSTIGAKEKYTNSKPSIT